MVYGLLFSGDLVFYGCFRFGIWFLFALSGLYGENGIIVFSRIWSARNLISLNYFPILCMIGLQFGAIPALFLLFLS
jgi:hypothetical protein